MIQTSLVFVALTVALWSVRRTYGSASTRRTGEVVWSIVAVAVLAVVAISVRVGGSHGF